MLARTGRFFPEAPSEALLEGQGLPIVILTMGGLAAYLAPYGPGRPIVKMTMVGLVACLAPYGGPGGIPGPL